MSKLFGLDSRLVYILIAVVLVLYVVNTGAIQMPSFSLVLPETNVNVNNSTPLVVDGVNDEPNPVVVTSDLRLVAAPYLVASDIDTYCVALGGTWRFEHDFVGCQGVGSADCSQPIIQAALSQCIGANANFVCSATNIYCAN